MGVNFSEVNVNFFIGKYINNTFNLYELVVIID